MGSLSIHTSRRQITSTNHISQRITSSTIKPLSTILIRAGTPMTLTPLNPRTNTIDINRHRPNTIVSQKAPRIRLLLTLRIRLNQHLRSLMRPPNHTRTINNLNVTIRPIKLPLSPIPNRTRPLRITLSTINMFLPKPFTINIIRPRSRHTTNLIHSRPIRRHHTRITSISVPHKQKHRANHNRQQLLSQPTLSRTTIFIRVNPDREEKQP